MRLSSRVVPPTPTVPNTKASRTNAKERSAPPLEPPPVFGGEGTALEVGSVVAAAALSEGEAEAAGDSEADGEAEADGFVSRLRTFCSTHGVPEVDTVVKSNVLTVIPVPVTRVVVSAGVTSELAAADPLPF